MSAPTLKAGYAFMLATPNLVDVFKCASDLWETEVIGEEIGGARHLGVRRIDGTECNVWIVNEGDDEQMVVAQTIAMGGA